MATDAGVVATVGFRYRADHGTQDMRAFMTSLREAAGRDNGGRGAVAEAFVPFSEFAVHNARLEGPELETHGFTLVPHPTAEDWRADPQAVREGFGDDVVEFVRGMCTADDVFMQGGPVVRSEAAQQERRVAGPALFTHTDFQPDHKDTLVSAVEALAGSDSAPERPDPVAEQIVAAGLSADDIRESRVVMLNTWRPIMAQPLQRFPLALCDCRSVQDGEVLGARGGCVWSPEHRWLIFPEQTKDELLLFVGYDSAAPTFTPTLHTSWDNRCPTPLQPLPQPAISAKGCAAVTWRVRPTRLPG